MNCLSSPSQSFERRHDVVERLETLESYAALHERGLQAVLGEVERKHRPDPGPDQRKYGREGQLCTALWAFPYNQTAKGRNSDTAVDDNAYGNTSANPAIAFSSWMAR